MGRGRVGRGRRWGIVGNEREGVGKNLWMM